MSSKDSLITITNNILVKCQLICEYIHRQNYFFASQTIKESISLISEFMKYGSTVINSDVLNELISIFKEISTTQECNNYVLLSDLFELKLFPLLSEIQKYLLNNSTVNTDYLGDNLPYLEDSLKNFIIENQKTSSFNNYYIEFTNTGATTLCVDKSGQSIYLHSNGDPYKEARLFADEYSENSFTDYIVFGIGLGYHVNALLDRDMRYNVTVLDNNIDIISLALTYTDFSKYLSSGRLTIKYIQNLEEVSSFLTSETGKFVIHYPSLHIMDDSPYKSILKDYFVSLSTIQSQSSLLNSNFHFNSKLNDAPIDNIKDSFAEKNIIYAGGGPSLELRMDELKNLLKEKDTIFICAGTVYKKLLDKGITPDYVIITDPSPILVNQIQGSKESTSSMLYLSTASKDAVGAFNGARYIIYQSGYKPAENVCTQNNYTCFETGGSVSTTAIDIALRYKCKKLICIGLDLAFTNNERHAFGLDGSITTSHNLLAVEAVGGGTINTSRNLNMYRKWIENRIKSEHDTQLINMSQGAKIHGMTDI